MAWYAAIYGTLQRLEQLPKVQALSFAPCKIILFCYIAFKTNDFIRMFSGIFTVLLQVLHALLPVLCSSDSSQQMPGARQFAVQQIGGHVCIQGVFQVLTS